ncbi:MAG: universal stress protein [Planctomycetota bacterium]
MGLDGSQGGSMVEYRNILFCTDFSKNADRAFEDATHLASLSSGYLYVLHVVPARGRRMTAALWSAEEAEETDEADEARVLDFLERTYGGKTAVAHEVAVRHGNEAEEILKFADAHDVKVIVMGARGMGRLSGLLGPGSVADKVMQSAKIPVLLVPKYEYEEYRDKVREQLARHRGIPLRTDVGLVLKHVRETQERERPAHGGKPE